MINALAPRGQIFMAMILAFIACDQNRNAENASNARSTAAPAPEKAQSAFDFVNSIGVNTHLNYFDTAYGNFQTVEQKLGLLGIRHVRDGVHLQNADYNKSVYSRWAQLRKDGIRFDAVVDPRSNLGPITASKLDEVAELADHAIESLEGPNELDISNISNWESVDRDYQQVVYKSVASMTGSKSVAVIGPSLASARKGSSLGNLSDRLNYGNLHPYPAGKMPSTVFPEQLILARKVSSDKKIFVTESGYHNALNDHSDQPAVSEAAAAKYIPRLFLENFSHGISRTYLYEFMDEVPDPNLTKFQMHWGLIRSDGSEKPAFTALKNLISELNDSVEPATPGQLTYSLGTQSTSLHHLLLQKSDGQFFLILWQEAASYDTRNQKDITVSPAPVKLTLGHRVRSVTTFEPAVQAQPLQISADVADIPLDVPDHPLVVQIAP